MIRSRVSLSLFVLLLSTHVLSAHEGMWLPIYLKGVVAEDMKKAGAQISVDEIWNTDRPSLSDAVVHFNGGCTGELVSPNGLLLTNHHCGFDAIAKASTEEKNYLKNGYWAKSYEEEIPTDIDISILVDMINVTDQLKDLPGPQERKAVVDSITTAAVGDNAYLSARVKEYFEGNEYYLLVSKVYPDVRFVGTPPASIGKYGGDTDNWMWPRHTGDFSVFRVYADAAGEPAPFSRDNVPYQPKQYLKISLAGVDSGDFTLVMGYPGSTERYLTSADVKHTYNVTSPAFIQGLGGVLESMDDEMAKDEATRLKLVSSHASLANYHKFLIGQQRQLSMFDLIGQKQEFENELRMWLNDNATADNNYGYLLDSIAAMNVKLEEVEPYSSGLVSTVFRTGLFGYLFQLGQFTQPLLETKMKRKERKKKAAAMIPLVDQYFDRNMRESDKNIFKDALYSYYLIVKDEERMPSFMKLMLNGNEMNDEQVMRKIAQYVDEGSTNSVFMDRQSALSFLRRPKKKHIEDDPILRLRNEILNYYRSDLTVKSIPLNNRLSKLRKQYIQALREWKTDSTFYPDANSTFRITYGNVSPYYPRDGVMYDYYTTHYGVLAKYQPGDLEFDMPQEAVDGMKLQNFGRYAENDTLRINFLTTTDITGGNSGSPVLNARGELIGLAFDGNWEAMIGDLYVEPTLNRTIAVDIRYVLWIIDKLSGAERLIQEMTIVEGAPN